MKTLLLLFAVVGLSGCMHGGPVFPNQEGWVVEHRQILGFSSSDFYYCQANKSPDKEAPNPKCYEAEVLPRRGR